MTRMPWLARVLAGLIAGWDADVLRGDLEEAYRRRLAAEGDSFPLRAATAFDAAASAARWWWTRGMRRARAAHARSESGGRMATIGPDLRQMWRGLGRRPGYAGMVALTLGLGIGATTTIYSVVDAMLVRPLPYPDAGRLVVVGNTYPGRAFIEGSDGVQQLERISLPNLRDLQQRVRGFERTAAMERRGWLHASRENPAEVLEVANVEEGFFDLLSVRPLLGRLPRDGDQAVDGGQWGAAISHESWQRRFDGDPNVLGKTFGNVRVIGVLPPDFVQPVALVGSDVEFWVHLDPHDGRYADRRAQRLKVLARLAPHAPLERVRRDLAAAQTRLAEEQPLGNRLPEGGALGVGINSLRDATIGAGGQPVLVFLGASLLLLLLAGTNAANLLIVRGLERDGELSLRRALGATRARLTWNLVAESLSLAIAGGALGLALAAAGVAAFRRFGPQSLPRMSEVAVNPRIVLAGVLLSVMVGILVGIVPAIRGSGANLLTNLRSSLTAFSPRGTRLRTALAATQLALALVLGVGASLLFRSFVHLRSEHLGFQPNGLVAFTVAFKNERPWELWDQIIERVAALPGITAAGGASALPFESPGLSLRFAPIEQDRNAPTAAVAAYSVNPTFFAAARIPILHGRAFDASDRPESHRVVIVNQRFARAHFGDRNPIGQFLRNLDAESQDAGLEIVGVAGSVVQARVEDGLLPAVYLPHTQLPAPLSMLVATRRDPQTLARDISRAVADAGLWNAPVLELSSMQSRIGASLSAPRFQLMLIGAFAGTAVLLAAIGLYATLAFTVRSRTRELGIRIAMGASQRQIFELVLRQGATVLAIGLAAGLAGALGLTRLLQGFLYRVSPIDPVAFLGAMGIVVIAVLLAALRPAGRGARVDPLSTMRDGG